jgi:hypothetical protein
MNFYKIKCGAQCCSVELQPICKTVLNQNLNIKLLKNLENTFYQWQVS